ncbi:hypothetical protein AAFF_G00392190 [Aldrovandia affinis]|uniref:R-spondin Fu-CRD domain-containing protein n=1 Tax=Aldrovandia affinis TaxID=143900 RepID=A0AAD7SE05_9TELE|nr:hypothetical protein AAFF_G00392190 [Aldrovandia affinis]
MQTHSRLRFDFEPIGTIRTTKDVFEDCRSCLVCSRENGCESCPEKLFLFLSREDMRHHGSCLHSCPAGHYGMRGQDMNLCMKGCQLSPWDEWSSCTRNGLHCGFRWGRQSRTRETHRGSEGASPLCPTQREIRKCRMKKRCPEDEEEFLSRATLWDGGS